MAVPKGVLSEPADGGAHPSFAALKDLERAGVKILSCGSCVEAYKLVDKLAVGEITNAYEVVSLCDEYEQIKL